MSGISEDEKHTFEKNMRLVTKEIDDLLSYFELKKDYRKIVILNSIKNKLDIIFLEFEKLLRPRDLEDLNNG